MAGKITFRNGPHTSVVGHIVAPVEIPVAHRLRIEKILTRVLTDAELATLCNELAMVREFREMNDHHATSQDVKETLTAIAKMIRPCEAARAYTECDALTQGVLTSGLYKLGVRDFSAPDPELIRQAAAERLATFPGGGNGRPKESWRGRFAGFARRSWAGFGRSDDKAWQRNADGTLSDFAHYALTLLNASLGDGEEPYSANAVIKLLSEEDETTD